MSVVPPTVSLTPTFITAVPNDTITFTCSPSHTESGIVEVGWFSQGKVLLRQTKVNSSSLVFVFPPDKEVVWVECVMRNSVGCDHATAVVTVQGLYNTCKCVIVSSNMVHIGSSSATSTLPQATPTPNAPLPSLSASPLLSSISPSSSPYML